MNGEKNRKWSERTSCFYLCCVCVHGYEKFSFQKESRSSLFSVFVLYFISHRMHICSIWSWLRLSLFPASVARLGFHKYTSIIFIQKWERKKSPSTHVYLIFIRIFRFNQSFCICIIINHSWGGRCACACTYYLDYKQSIRLTRYKWKQLSTERFSPSNGNSNCHSPSSFGSFNDEMKITIQSWWIQINWRLRLYNLANNQVISPRNSCCECHFLCSTSSLDVGLSKLVNSITEQWAALLLLLLPVTNPFRFCFFFCFISIRFQCFNS